MRKAYLKAANICHPDKILVRNDQEHLYIATRCFAALTEAFNQYKVNIMFCLVNLFRKMKDKIESV